MNLLPDKKRGKQIAFVLCMFLFLIFVIVLAKIIGDGWLVPLIFIIGWIIFITLIINKHFKKIKQFR